MLRCPWASHLTLIAPDELAVALRGWLRHWCVNVRQYCKALWVATGLKSAVEMQSIYHLTFIGFLCFQSVDWACLLTKTLPPPFLPKISAPCDVSNFDSDFTCLQPVLSPLATPLSPRQQNIFQGFDYSALHSWERDDYNNNQYYCNTTNQCYIYTFMDRSITAILTSTT